MLLLRMAQIFYEKSFLSSASLKMIFTPVRMCELCLHFELPGLKISFIGPSDKMSDDFEFWSDICMMMSDDLQFSFIWK
jgi:hypothetical protein